MLSWFLMVKFRKLIKFITVTLMIIIIYFPKLNGGFLGWVGFFKIGDFSFKFFDNVFTGYG